MKKAKPIYYSIPEYNNIDTSYYYEEKRRLQVTLLKVQEWVKKNNKRKFTESGLAYASIWTYAQWG